MNVKYIEELGDIILEEIGDKYNMISVVADIDEVWDIFMYLYNEYDIKYDYINIDRYEYKNHYYLSVTNYDDIYEVNIEPAFNDEKNCYFSSTGKVYVKHDIYQKYIKDINDNKYVRPEETVAWSIGDEEEDNDADFKFCVDDDEMGFCVCHDCGNGYYREFKYKGNRKLTDKDINRILNENGWN